MAVLGPAEQRELHSSAERAADCISTVAVQGTNRRLQIREGSARSQNLRMSVSTVGNGRIELSARTALVAVGDLLAIARSSVSVS